MRGLKFGAVGVVNTAADFALYSMLTLAVGLGAVGANLISYSVGIILSFLLNRAWTFKDRGGSSMVSQLILFVAGSLGGLAISTAIVGFLTGPCGVLLAKAVSILATFIWNYCFSNLVVFRR
jgi:putative flippase GtrA